MHDKITLVIPTYNRHHLLNRVLPYLGDMHLPTLIIDSTATPYECTSLSPLIDYVHCPELDVVAKMRKYIGERVYTPYILLNADDMYPSGKCIKEAIRLLDDDSTYSAVQGSSLGHKNGTISFAHCQGHFNFPTDADRPSARLLQHFARYCPIVYSVQRTDCWNVTLSKLPNEIVNYNFMEFYLCMMFLVHGKVARIPDFAHITDLVPSINFKSKKFRGTTKDMRSNPDFYPELMAVKRTVSEFLAEKEGLNVKTAFRYVEGALDMYLARILPSRDYYWLRNKPPKTIKYRIQKEWSNLLGKTILRKQNEKIRKDIQMQSAEQESQSVKKIVAASLDDYQRILCLLTRY